MYQLAPNLKGRRVAIIVADGAVDGAQPRPAHGPWIIEQSIGRSDVLAGREGRDHHLAHLAFPFLVDQDI